MNSSAFLGKFTNIRSMFAGPIGKIYNLKYFREILPRVTSITLRVVNVVSETKANKYSKHNDELFYTKDSVSELQ